MPLFGLLATLGRHPLFQEQLSAILDSLEQTARPRTGPPPQITLRPGARPVWLGALWAAVPAPVLVLTPRSEDARRLHDQLLTYLGETAPVYLLPEPEVLPFERLAVDSRTVSLRLTALAALARCCAPGANDPRPPLVVASIGAALRLSLPPGAMGGVESSTSEANPTISLIAGQRVPRLDHLLGGWVRLGYRSVPVVEAPGSFAQRGGIIDVFPAQADLPLRLELWDDQVESIRTFDPASQRSMEEVRGETRRLDIIPAREQLPHLADPAAVSRQSALLDFSRCHPDVRERMEEELAALLDAPNLETLSFYNGLLNRHTLLDYLPPGCLVVLDRPSLVQSDAQDQEEKYLRMRLNREERGELPVNFPAPYRTWEECLPALERLPQLHLQSFLSAGIASEVGMARRDGPDVFRPAPLYYGKLDQLAADLRDERSRGRAVVVVSHHAPGRVAEILEQEGVSATKLEGLDQPPEPGQVCLVAGSLREGWNLEVAGVGLTLLTDAELFGTAKEQSRRTRGRREGQSGPAIVLEDLVPGSYVVHIDHGVAKFAGTTHMADTGDDREYLVLEYADGDKLYVPTEHLDRVSAYVGSQDQAPSLTRLGTAEWSRIKERVKGATKELAQELLQLYAARQAAQGHEFGADTVWQRELEDSFPYQETPDQARAVDEVKADMEQTKPMDRLICGDVGYGKTEVALRAAFKAVGDGMQVGLLVPTTVLAQQHYATFSERLQPFPIRVEVLSRFRTPAEQDEVIAGLKDGAVDIVIGTHRLLQKDVGFKNLGLVVVDEEQRFGVAHKEHLKRLRREVDVLTLSATPIPRTLHMALSGIRDMSNMETPPESRLPVKTFVSEYSEDLIKEAILRELERDGQVFFLHNRVKSIHEVAGKLAELVPQARILVGHGQMPEAELEEVMLAFSRGEGDILVCTTIIESGLDLPNANTLIVDHADRFGLAQLYQLRGRVGRGDHRAYAYLLVPRGRRITPAAEQRLQAILEASELGAGFRIAMRDLEIRGAGNLLGAAQSGNIYAVGLELYGQLLKQAVAEAGAEAGQASANGSALFTGEVFPRVEVPLPAHLPESYIPHLPSRLAVYQRLAKVRQRSEVPELRAELRDRFGPLPEEVEHLLQVVDLRALAGTVGIESVVHSGEAITMMLRHPVGGARAAVQRALGPSVSVGNQQLHLPTRQLGDQWLTRLKRLIERLQVFQERLPGARA
ncbi:MAG: transcription-repair coupling factor [Dehalococcoidia bacterium]|nr:transcription-repair coupling factor [Dehalococcoidia bacterium]MSQ16977.1 transcription-repair coupling factor [Dehalococcoidia bacterium]